MPHLIPSQRHLFDIPQDVAYLNCAFMSPITREAAQAGRNAVYRKTQPWKITHSDFFEDLERARSLFASIIGAKQDDIAVIPSVSYGISTAAANAKVQADQSVVILQNQFPSNVYPWTKLARQSGAKVKIVKPIVTQEGYDCTTPILDAIDSSTAIVSIPHCRWTDGSIIDVEAVSRKVRKFNAMLVLDVVQSLGVLPIDINNIKPDFLVAACYKWLMGPYSLGFMYVSPKYQNGTPIDESWANRKDATDVSTLLNFPEEYQSGARRFDMGQKANFHTIPIAISGINQILKWGIDNIYYTLGTNNDLIAEHIAKMGFYIAQPNTRAKHFLGVEYKQGIINDITAKLAQQNVYVSVRGSTIRITPHIYNTQNDFERMLSALKKCIM